MPTVSVDLDQLSEEDKAAALNMLAGLRDLDTQLAEAKESVKELRVARNKHYAKLMDFVEECQAGEPPLMKG